MVNRPAVHHEMSREGQLAGTGSRKLGAKLFDGTGYTLSLEEYMKANSIFSVTFLVSILGFNGMAIAGANDKPVTFDSKDFLVSALNNQPIDGIGYLAKEQIRLNRAVVREGVVDAFGSLSNFVMGFAVGSKSVVRPQTKIYTVSLKGQDQCVAIFLGAHDREGSPLEVTFDNQKDGKQLVCKTSASIGIMGLHLACAKEGSNKVNQQEIPVPYRLKDPKSSRAIALTPSEFKDWQSENCSLRDPKPAFSGEAVESESE